MKTIRDEFNLLPVLWKLGYFCEYLRDVEELVDSKAQELDNRAKVMAQKLEQDEDFPWEYSTPDGLAYFFLEEDYEKIENVFPNLLRRSFFLYVYFVLEDALNNCCRLLNYQSKSLNDVEADDESIRRARKYLKDAYVKFPDSNEWNKILGYQKLRNCMTHNMGRLKGCKPKEVNVIRRLASRNPHLSLRYTDDESKNIKEMSKEDIEKMPEYIEVMFHKGFCEEVIQTISDFLGQLRTSMEYRHRNEQF